MAARRMALELLLANHPEDCLACARNGSCELQAMAERMGIRERRFARTRKALAKDTSAEGISRDNDKCILCGRCVAVCAEVQGVTAIQFAGRGIRTHVAPFMDRGLATSACVQCGQCSVVCPTGAITERDESREVWRELRSPARTVVVQTAPAIRASLGEALGMEAGTLVTGKMVAALRRLGFDKVFDTQFAADLTIMEEGTEFVKRLTAAMGKGMNIATREKSMPLITSCCPAWVDYMEKYFPDMVPNFSTAKSPQQMMGTMIKTYWAEKAAVNPAKIFSVSVMPCTAKKYETHRDESMYASGLQDVDISITTRELARMIKQAGIDLVNLPESEADNPMGPYTGAGAIFGATGGVMEAALRTAHTLVTGQELHEVNFTAVRGLSGIKEATIRIGDVEIKVAIAHQMGNIQQVLEQVRKARDEGGETPWHFIEVMACRGGCIGGGGQPYGATDEVRKLRIRGIYDHDETQEYRCSHHNPYIKKIYTEYLESPGSHKAHKLLHTHYVERPLFLK
jgi:NADH-quinone oxidoreductase subunit G